MDPRARRPVLRVALPLAFLVAVIAGRFSTPSLALPSVRDPSALLWNLVGLVAGAASPGFVALNAMRWRSGDRRGTAIAIALWGAILVLAGLPLAAMLLGLAGGAVAVGAN